MKLSIPWRPFGLLFVLWVCLAFAYSMQVSADAPPQMSKDGLQLKTQTKQRLVYVKPGAKFSQYDRVMILDCYIEIQKN